jgi:hypothetical protein
MLKDYAIIRQSAAHLAAAARRTTVDYERGRVGEEPDFTGRMLGRIAEAMDGYELKGVRWDARILTSHGPGAQERRIGADFLGVLEVDLPGYRTTKGFLAQAKLLGRSGNITRTELVRLQDQCDSMLAQSSASYVFLYSASSITVVPAVAILAMSLGAFRSIYSRDIAKFFEEHFECFVGDPRLNWLDAETLVSPNRPNELASRALALGLRRK